MTTLTIGSISGLLGGLLLGLLAFYTIKRLTGFFKGKLKGYPKFYKYFTPKENAPAG